MSHWSEESSRLRCETRTLCHIAELENLTLSPTQAFLFQLPSVLDSRAMKEAKPLFERLAAFSANLPKEAVVCWLTSPEIAATLLPFLEGALKFQLWIAVRQVKRQPDETKSRLPNTHTALLVMTRYREALRHTKTRIGYTYCPSCGKTTKDYGGKKHTYHEYGTLMADVWRDVEIDTDANIESVTDRLRDLFGLAPFATLTVIDLRKAFPRTTKSILAQESRLPLEWNVMAQPQNSRLLNSDCLEALRTLPDNSIDFCFTDPPYNLDKKYDRWDDALEAVAYFKWCDQWLTELYRVLKPGGTLAVLNIPQWTVRHFQHLRSLMIFQDWIVWEALGFPVRQIMPAHYAILCFSKGPARPLPGLNDALDTETTEALAPLAEGYCIRVNCIRERNRMGNVDRAEITDVWADIHRLKHNSRRVDHPCQLPPALMQRLFALFTRRDETILDCFNGAGTSTLVAQQMQRRYIGIEVSQKYHQIAVERHTLLSSGGNPFARNDTIPDVKNSRVQRMPRQKYEVSKKVLQLEVRRIARQIGRLPTRQEVETMGEYPIAHYDAYFASWGEVCAAARTTGMSETPKEVPPATTQTALFLLDEAG